MIRYSNGELMFETPDLSSNGFGEAWGHTRSYSNRLSANPSNEGVNGVSWFVKETPRLANINPDPGDPNQATIIVMGTISEAIWFDYDSGTGSYIARFFVQDTLVHDGDEFVYADARGRRIKFHDFSVSTPALRGQFKSFTTPYGQEWAAAYGANNQIQSFTQRGTGPSGSGSGGSGSSGPSDETTGYDYDYYQSGENAGRLLAVTQGRGMANVRRSRYVYYRTGMNEGNSGDLQTMKLQQYQGGKWDDLGTTYYRYYRSGDAKGFAHGLKYLVSPATYARLARAGIIPETVPDSVLAMYADYYFEYDGNQRVSLVSISGLRELYTYDYTPSAHADGYNNWKMKTVETLPDGNVNIVYTNYAGQVMFKIFRAGPQEWYEYYRFDSAGRTILKARSSAVASYSEVSPGLVTLKSSSGLVRVYDYYTSGGTGAVVGYLQAEKVQQGGSGSPVQVREWQYTTQSNGTDSVSPVWKEIAYQSDASGGSSPSVTEYAYLWYGSSLQMQQRITYPPVIAGGQNGDGNTYNRDEVFDVYGRVTWQRDELGFMTRTLYDGSTGAVLQLIQDVDTSVVGDAPAGWTTPAGGGLNLITDYTIDNLGRTTQSLGPLHQIDLNGTAVRIRWAAWTVYLDVKGEQRSGTGYWKRGDGSYTLVNPVRITRSNGTGAMTDEIAAVRTDVHGRLTAADEFPRSTWVRWRSRKYGGAGLLLHEREYFLIPASGAGDSGVNYNQSNYAYDIMRRLVRQETPGGTITRYVLSPQGWTLETWVGTDDTLASNADPGAGGMASNNMKQVTANEYDGGADKGDGNLTQVTQYVSDSTSQVTVYGYDWRNRQTSTDGEVDFYQVQTYDNLDRVVQVDRRNTNSGGNLIRRSEMLYDDQGRVYQTVTYAVDPTTGTVGNALTSNTWYDPAGNTIQLQTIGNSAFQKTIRDGIRRVIKQFTSTNPTQSGYPYPVDVSGDVVYEQMENAYDGASNLILLTSRSRFHDATGTGELTDPNGAQPKARVSYVAMWPDALGRQHHTANYGTNHGASLTRPVKAPQRSNKVLVTTTEYNDRGEVVMTTDPKGTVTQFGYDGAGRRIQAIENYVNGGTGSDQNRETNFAYNADGRVKTLTVKNSITGDQVTQYVYGTTLSDSDIASNELLRQMIYPGDKKSDRDRVTMSYNRIGQVKQKLDQLGTVHDYDYDLLGRPEHDRVTTLGGGVDGTVLRISQSYEVRGMVQKLTSYDHATVGSGSVVNEVQFAYNDFSQLMIEYQAHNGAVNTGSSPKVQYGYADGSANTIRLTALTHPDGRELNYDYGTTDGPGDLLSRVSSLIDDDGSTPLADYTYLGLGGIVEVNFPPPGTRLTYIGGGTGDGGDQYRGWDRFGRVIDQRWLKGGSALERLKFGYDRASNRLWRRNVVAGSGQDEFYTYDGLYQLLKLQRGTLNGNRTGISGTPVWEEDFTFDPTGNWAHYATKVNGTASLNQDRTHNKVNEIRTIDGSNALMKHNAAGNISKAPRPSDWTKGCSLYYDAWQRLVRVKQGTANVGIYRYDGTNRRVSKQTGATTRHYYYTKAWQIVEERLDSATTADRQFVWGLRHLDDLILRDRNTERLYGLQDVFSCTAVTDAVGAVKERYGYDAFGQSRVMKPGFGNRNSSKYDWETRYDSYRFDKESGFYQVRHRFLHPTLGRWTTRDPVGYGNGANLYCYVANGQGIDPLGLFQIHYIDFPKWIPASEYLWVGHYLTFSASDVSALSAGPIQNTFAGVLLLYTNARATVTDCKTGITLSDTGKSLYFANQFLLNQSGVLESANYSESFTDGQTHMFFQTANTPMRSVFFESPGFSQLSPRVQRDLRNQSDKQTKGSFDASTEFHVNAKNAYDITVDIFRPVTGTEMGTRFKRIDGHEAWGAADRYFGVAEGQMPGAWGAMPAFSDRVNVNFEWDNCCEGQKWKYRSSPASQPGYNRSRYATTTYPGAVNLHQNPVSE